jgi:hypothetical protein
MSLKLNFKAKAPAAAPTVDAAAVWTVSADDFDDSVGSLIRYPKVQRVVIAVYRAQDLLANDGDDLLDEDDLAKASTAPESTSLSLPISLYPFLYVSIIFYQSLGSPLPLLSLFTSLWSP